MENEDILLTQEYFKPSYKKEDVTTLPSFKKWIKIKEEQGKKIVKCPWCWGYEIFKEPTNHTCPMCKNLYCQKCLQKCVQDEVMHNHDRGCWSKFCGLIDIMIDWGKDADATPLEYLKASLIFIFGNHFLYTMKYFDFFKKNKLIDNDCVHSFFTYMNLFTNLIYCIVFNIAFFEFFFFLFFPGIFIDESPITELTVRGRGYDMY